MAISERSGNELSLDFEGMQRDASFFDLIWASEGSIIGSGWLFGALTAATLAGPAVIISWIIASVIIIILALVHAELGGMFPVTGGTSRYPHYSFGSFAGATFGWFAYVQAAAVAPIEVLAVIQYFSSVSWAHGIWNANKGILSGSGIVVAIVLMILFTAVNLIGIRWLARANTSITSWKVIIPILTIIIFLLFKFHGSNFSAGGGFFLKSGAFKAILDAIPAGGIVFSLLGFEQAVQIAGESKNPSRDVPRAVIGSIVLGGLIYILVQVAFIGALDPALLTQAGTWAHLNDPNTKNVAIQALQASPFFTVAKLAGIGWLAWILRVDAAVSPGGTALIYLTSASRISFGLSKNGYVPDAFEKNNKFKVPTVAILVTSGVGILFLLPFPSWNSMVGVITSASVIMYAGAPLALGALRKTKADLPRSYRLPAADILAPVSFILANWIVYWSGWVTYSTLMVFFIIGVILIGASFVFNLNSHRPDIDWTAAIWVVPYLVGMGILSWFGQFGTGHPFNGFYGFEHILNGGTLAIPFYWDLLIVAAFSLVIYYGAQYFRLPTSQVDKYIAEVYPAPAE